jgi:hypothetical protein
VMKPKPLVSLKNFTGPVFITCLKKENTQRLPVGLRHTARPA